MGINIETIFDLGKNVPEKVENTDDKNVKNNSKVKNRHKRKH